MYSKRILFNTQRLYKKRKHNERKVGMNILEMIVSSIIDMTKVVTSARFATSRYDKFGFAIAAIIGLGINPNETLFNRRRIAKFIVNNFLRNLSMR